MKTLTRLWYSNIRCRNHKPAFTFIYNFRWWHTQYHRGAIGRYDVNYRCHGKPHKLYTGENHGVRNGQASLWVVTDLVLGFDCSPRRLCLNVIWVGERNPGLVDFIFSMVAAIFLLPVIVFCVTYCRVGVFLNRLQKEGA